MCRRRRRRRRGLRPWFSLCPVGCVCSGCVLFEVVGLTGCGSDHGVSFHRVPLQAVLSCSGPGHVGCDIVVVDVCCCWLQLKQLMWFFLYLGRSSAFPTPFRFGRYRWAPFCNEPCPAVVVAFGNHSGQFPAFFALSEVSWFHPVSCHQVVLQRATQGGTEEGKERERNK